MTSQHRGRRDKAPDGIRQPGDQLSRLGHCGTLDRFREWVLSGLGSAALRALAATSVLHLSVALRGRPGLNSVAIWLFVSAIAAATSLPMRRWIEAVRSLRILPPEGLENYGGYAPLAQTPP